MQKSNNKEKTRNNNLNFKIKTLISKSHNSSLTTHHTGITLIALVVTIVVLLILAGVTITLMFGDNNIFDVASEASIKTKLGELEDKLGVIYSNLVVQKHKENWNREITTEDIINKLHEEGYEIKEVPLVQNDVTGIEIEGVTNGKIALKQNETKELTVTITTNTNEGEKVYYAVIEGENYEIKLENGKLKVNRKPQKVESEEPSKAELKVEAIEGTTVIASKKENEEKVVLQAGGTAGQTKIKVTYGGKPLEFTAEVEIKPLAEAEEDIEGVTFSTAYGKIDIIWLEGTSNTPSSTQTPNSPANYLNGMQPIKWNGTTEATTTVSDTSWYSYNEATGTTDSKTSHWANAKTTNGSYFVWIPRYAYRITYYDKEPNTDNTATVTGYYDGYGMWKADTGELKCKLETDNNGKTLVETVQYNGENYIVHPAFGTNLDMGGWSKNLPGFWFAKFKMTGDGTNSTSLKSTPGVQIYRQATIGTFYTVARSATYGMTGTVDNTANGGDGKTSFMNSHMAKNSEWGAVAYLTHSKYGRNGYEISFSNTGYYTGGLTGTTSYTGTSNQLQSTTGNVYGVYDMRGESYEYTASWDTLAADSNNYISTNGSSFASKNGSSTKYATAYKNGTTEHMESPAVYNVCKTGDGIKEIWVSSSVGWHSDEAYFVYTTLPFFSRGGDDHITSQYTGVFGSTYVSGRTSVKHGFRGVLCP